MVATGISYSQLVHSSSWFSCLNLLRPSQWAEPKTSFTCSRDRLWGSRGSGASRKCFALALNGGECRWFNFCNRALDSILRFNHCNNLITICVNLGNDPMACEDEVGTATRCVTGEVNDLAPFPILWGPFQANCLPGPIDRKLEILPQLKLRSLVGMLALSVEVVGIFLHSLKQSRTSFTTSERMCSSDPEGSATAAIDLEASLVSTLLGSCTWDLSFPICFLFGRLLRHILALLNMCLLHLACFSLGCLCLAFWLGCFWLGCCLTLSAFSGVCHITCPILLNLGFLIMKILSIIIILNMPLASAKAWFSVNLCHIGFKLFLLFFGCLWLSCSFHHWTIRAWWKLHKPFLLMASSSPLSSPLSSAPAPPFHLCFGLLCCKLLSASKGLRILYIGEFRWVCWSLPGETFASLLGGVLFASVLEVSTSELGGWSTSTGSLVQIFLSFRAWFWPRFWPNKVTCQVYKSIHCGWLKPTFMSFLRDILEIKLKITSLSMGYHYSGRVLMWLRW